jgi:hypothetical protein
VIDRQDDFNAYLEAVGEAKAGNAGAQPAKE